MGLGGLSPSLVGARVWADRAGLLGWATLPRKQGPKIFHKWGRGEERRLPAAE